MVSTQTANIQLTFCIQVDSEFSISSFLYSEIISCYLYCILDIFNSFNHFYVLIHHLSEQAL